MRDELFDRDYAGGRDAFHAGIDQLIAKLGDVFSATARVNFDAPWKNRRPSPKSGPHYA
jgi:hypothetical protein